MYLPEKMLVTVRRKQMLLVRHFFLFCFVFLGCFVTVLIYKIKNKTILILSPVYNYTHIFSDDSFDITSKKVNALINWDASNDRTGWIKFGVGYCFPCVLRIDQCLFSPAIYENLTRNGEKRMIFFSLFESLQKLIITVRSYYWDFLPFKLIFAKHGNGCGLDLQFCSDS